MTRKSNREFTPEDAEWLMSRCAEIERIFTERFAIASATFPTWKRLVARLHAARDATLRQGWGHWHETEEAHNELCVADALLSLDGVLGHRIEYEPRLRNTSAPIDFQIVLGKNEPYIDVKTIAPRFRDRWGQFERLKNEGRFPPQTEIVLDKNWLGGEIWHSKFAARTSMLNYTLEFEQKIEAAQIDPATPAILAFCGDGYHWHEDELEDFVDFYRSGHHRNDDPLAQMEKHDIAKRNLRLSRRVTQFALVHRGSNELLPRQVVWDVRPPRRFLG
jgi:hypothetical protein